MTTKRQWYVVTLEDGVEICDSEKEARDLAQSEIDRAIQDHWHESVGQIEWGEMLPRQFAVQKDLVETPGEEHDYTCRYELEYVSPTQVEHRVMCPGCGKTVDLTAQVESRVVDRMLFLSEQLDTVGALHADLQLLISRQNDAAISRTALGVEKVYSADLEEKLTAEQAKRATLMEACLAVSDRLDHYPEQQNTIRAAIVAARP